MEQESEPIIYRIKIEGHLDKAWARWFESLTVSHDEDGNTILTGPIADQSALRGILSKLWDLNLTLLSVNQIRMNRGRDGLRS